MEKRTKFRVRVYSSRTVRQKTLFLTAAPKCLRRFPHVVFPEMFRHQCNAFVGASDVDNDTYEFRW